MTADERLELNRERHAQLNRIDALRLRIVRAVSEGEMFYPTRRREYPAKLATATKLILQLQKLVGEFDEAEKRREVAA
jgi:hypothetical protein